MLIMRFLLYTDTPDAPKNLDIPKYDKRSCELTWDKPDFDGGNPVTGMLKFYPCQTCLQDLTCLVIVSFSTHESILMTFIQFSGYVVEKRSRGGDWVPVNNFPVKDTKFTVMGLQEGTVVEFRVAAVNDGGPGKFSKATPPHQVRDQVCKQIGHLLTHL